MDYFTNDNFTLFKGVIGAFLITILLTGCFAETEKNAKEGGDKNMSKVRKPAVAGQWYSQDSNKLRSTMEEMFNKADVNEELGAIKGVIAPHAGFVYSGWVAAHSFKPLKMNPDLYEDKTFIVMGISHRVRCSGIAVWEGGAFKTPLGKLEIDREVAEDLVEADSRIEFNNRPHIPEHSLEAELPFLQYALGSDVKIVPVIFCQQDRSTINSLVKAFSEIPHQDELFFIASTDMSHYHPYSEAKKMDKKALDMTADLEINALRDALQKKEVGYCGAGPVLTLMELAERKSLSSQVLQYATSADVKHGDKSKVVGYCSIVFSEKGASESKGNPQNEERGEDPPQNSSKEETEKQKGKAHEDKVSKDVKEYLLKLARRSLEKYVKQGERPQVDLPDYELLTKERAVFVTLHKNGQLRGCIGGLKATMPLYKAVIDKAISAATQDRRFTQVKPEEFEDIDIEISILSPLKRIESHEQIEPFKHGVYVRKNGRTGVYLPQVWEQIPDKGKFLRKLCSSKAFLAPDAYKDSQTQLFIFTVKKFSEKGMFGESK